MQELIIILIGLVMIVSGIIIMRKGLKKIFWQKMYNILSRLTITPFRGMLAGIVAAVIMQSSTTVSLITIAMVSAEYMSFYQGLGIILGANIGTCSTVQIMAVSPPDKWFWPILAAALAVAAISKRFRDPALALAGLFCMFIGLNVVNSALGNLAHLDILLKYIAAAGLNPLYGIMAGVIITLLFQSSSAATGVLMVLAGEGLIDIITAAYIVYGNNIGSCLSSVIAGIAAPLAAKRVAAAHIVLNVLGVMVFLPFTNIIARSAIYLSSDFGSQVAIIHTIFNILSSLAVLPVARYFAQFIAAIVPGPKGKID